MNSFIAGISHCHGGDRHHRQRGHGHVPVEGVRGARLPPHGRHLGPLPGLQVSVEAEAPHLPHCGQRLLPADHSGLITLSPLDGHVCIHFRLFFTTMAGLLRSSDLRAQACCCPGRCPASPSMPWSGTSASWGWACSPGPWGRSCISYRTGEMRL